MVELAQRTLPLRCMLCHLSDEFRHLGPSRTCACCVKQTNVSLRLLITALSKISQYILGLRQDGDEHSFFTRRMERMKRSLCLPQGQARVTTIVCEALRSAVRSIMPMSLHSTARFPASGAEAKIHFYPSRRLGIIFRS